MMSLFIALIILVGPLVSSAEDTLLTADFLGFYQDNKKLDKLQAGVITGKISVTNNTGTGVNVTPIIALYKHNRLVKSTMKGITVANASNGSMFESEAINFTLDADDNLHDYTIKLCLWNDFDKMQCIMNSVELDAFGSYNSFDIVVYGGTASGIISAVQATKMGKTVAVIEPSGKIGGMTTGGLGDTDYGIRTSIGGLALDFYKRVGQKYNESQAVWTFEAKVAHEVMMDYVQEYNIPIFYNERLDLQNGVSKTGLSIKTIKMESGRIFGAKMFIDATYEGDLMAKAGVPYIVGREGKDEYGETFAGICAGKIAAEQISPYIIPGNPSSGLLPRVNKTAGGNPGDADKGVQAYNYRWNLTKTAANRIVPTQAPDGYNVLEYELLYRALKGGMDKKRVIKVESILKNGDYDSNNHYYISTDYIGMSHDYAEADYETREKIAKEHERYQRGLLWFLQNDERLPTDTLLFRSAIKSSGKSGSDSF